MPQSKPEPAEKVPSVQLGAKIPQPLREQFEAAVNDKKKADRTINMSVVTRWLLAAWVDGRVQFDRKGNVITPAAPERAVEPATPAPAPKPEPVLPPLEPIDIRPPVPSDDYLGLNSVAYWYRNRKAGESFEQFLAAFEAERYGTESIHGWAVRTRNEEGGAA